MREDFEGKVVGFGEGGEGGYIGPGLRAVAAGGEERGHP